MARGTATLAMVLMAFAAIGSGCGGDDPAAAPAGSDASMVAVIKGLDNPFFGTMRDGLVATAKQYGTALKVEAAARQDDAAGQASRLDAQAGAGAGCYLVNPVNQTNLIQPLSRVPAGTPIVNIDSPVTPRQAEAIGVQITTYIGTDNIAAGRAAATAMAAIVAPGARIAVLAGTSGDATSEARVEGFQRGASEHFEVVSSTAADFDRSKAELAAEEVLDDDRRLTGIFAANDLMALGAAKAVRAAHRQNDVAVIGVDGIREALTAIRRGSLSATVAQYPYTIGQLGVQACLAAERKQKVPRRIDAPIQVVTGENVERAEANFPKPTEAFENPLDALLS
jgi:ABC-type sugar transport system substrate-binding protein